ncbi:MAG: alanine racemase [Planctomycetota bacterium]
MNSTARPALVSNLRFLRQSLGPRVRFTSVIKANAYGHGIAEFLPMAEAAGVDFFWTFNAAEASAALAARTRAQTRFGILGDVPSEALEWALHNGIELYVFDPSRLEQVIEWTRRTQQPARVHIEFETGLHRTGFTAADLPRIAKMVEDAPPGFTIQGFCTHLAGAESFANEHRIRHQMVRFEALAQSAGGLGLQAESRHAACSAAIFNFPSSRLDLVRCGIAQFGFWPSNETWVAWLRERPDRAGKPSPLRRVLSWKSRVLHVAALPFGEWVGYGHTFQAQRDMALAIVPVGYSAGFPRSQGGRGQVLIGGTSCPVIGTVNMNMLAVDITETEGVQPGDEVVLIGHQGDREISVGAFSERTKAFNYETLVRLDAGLERRVIEQSLAVV